MYLPHFVVDELPAIKAFVASRAAADLITVDTDGQPVSTLMPCVWQEDGSEWGRLVMHMARGNSQWSHTNDGARGLAIVHGDQAYVSPSYYPSKVEHGRVVPTWNYTAVHLSGHVEVSHDPALLLAIITELTDKHESHREHPWQVSDAPDEYIAAQLKAIVAITLVIDKVEAKAKVSQNRSDEDRAGVLLAFESSTNTAELHIASLMRDSQNPLGH